MAAAIASSGPTPAIAPQADRGHASLSGGFLDRSVGVILVVAGNASTHGVEEVGVLSGPDVASLELTRGQFAHLAEAPQVTTTRLVPPDAWWLLG
jgi:hypothetical protein